MPTRRRKPLARSEPSAHDRTVDGTLGSRWSRPLICLVLAASSVAAPWSTGTAAAPAPTPDASTDLDGDGTSDLVWLDDTGDVAIWIFRDGDVVESATYFVGADYTLVGIGDIDGDGRDDLVWQRSVSAGNAIALWQMDGTRVMRTAGFAVVGDSWVAETVADLDGDGRADILFQSRPFTDVTLGVWYLDGLGPPDGRWGTYAPLGVRVWPTNPIVFVAAADLDGDGASSVILRDTGAPDVMYSDSEPWHRLDFDRSRAPIASTFAWYVRRAGTSAGEGSFTAWFAPLDDDHAADAFWQRTDSVPSTSRSFIEYYVDDAPTGTRIMQPPSANLRFLGFGDYDGSGRADFVWAFCGHIAVWLNRADDTFSALDLGPLPVDSAWQLQPPASGPLTGISCP